MKAFKEFITELFDKPVSYKKTSDGKYQKGYIFFVDGIQYTLGMVDYGVTGGKEDEGDWGVAFTMDDPKTKSSSVGITNVGQKVAIIVFSTVLKIVSDFVKENQPRQISFSATKSEGGSRASLYKSMIKKYLPRGYEYTTENAPGGLSTRFTIKKK